MAVKRTTLNVAVLVAVPFRSTDISRLAGERAMLDYTRYAMSRRIC